MIFSPCTGNLSDNLKSYIITRLVAEKNSYEWGINPHPQFDYYNGVNQMDFFDMGFGKQHNIRYEETPDWVINTWIEKGEKRTHNGDTYDFFEYQPEVFDQPDNSKIIVKCLQNPNYYLPYKEKIQSWLNIKEELQFQYVKFLLNNNIFLDENMVVCSVRGGEFRGVPNLILGKQYWQNAIRNMLDKNPNSRFICVSEDPQYASELFDHTVTVIHLSAGGDWFILNQARNLILSNSGFGILPTFLNKNTPYVIAPKGWARHNIGVDCPADLSGYGWNFMNREGKIKNGVHL